LPAALRDPVTDEPAGRAKLLRLLQCEEAVLGDGETFDEVIQIVGHGAARYAGVATLSPLLASHRLLGAEVVARAAT
jgi:hypothetical protein